MKTIDMNRTVYDLLQSYPELEDILDSLGFHEIKHKAVQNTAGRIMTIPKGAKMRSVPMADILSALHEHGFRVEGLEGLDEAEGAKSASGKATADEAEDAKCREDRTRRLKEYLERLNRGEALDSVRKDFVAQFSEVDASEIMKAEQELISEGTPIEEIQRLCDLHSALFHGCTAAEKSVGLVTSIQGSTHFKTERDTTQEAALTLANITGHPLHTFANENRRLEVLIAEARNVLSSGGNIAKILPKIREVSIHYAKKGDLLYPHLKVKYDIFGPSNVMWTIDDEIRDELGALAKPEENPDSLQWKNRFEAVLVRMEEMIYKEMNILFPVCSSNFTEDEWKGIYRDSKDYAPCFGVANEEWDAAEAACARNAAEAQGHTAHTACGCGHSTKTAADRPGEVVMPGGHLTVEQLTAMLNTIPVEITFVDADDINRYFNEGPKVFKRPMMAIDRDVYSCHPPKVEVMVRAIIEDFRSGKRDSVPIWMEKNGSLMLVTYMAVRDPGGKYLGTLELVQDMDFAKEYFSKKLGK